ncbi:hypothetical protein M407DRAFT_92251 [Tulasnella calospora MUT 4182]|uniref:Uncharacterized protein n=1 Tax=Tulasnella calospora MUT 4182 TaxID=1051891 RepID=A0A0C3QHU1_9AGAM|nr:hypothetical protein M407DRAFT_92251 [Tulasnella calospora MUT 4182]
MPLISQVPNSRFPSPNDWEVVRSSSPTPLPDTPTALSRSLAAWIDFRLQERLTKSVKRPTGSRESALHSQPKRLQVSTRRRQLRLYTSNGHTVGTKVQGGGAGDPWL